VKMHLRGFGITATLVPLLFYFPIQKMYLQHSNGVFLRDAVLKIILLSLGMLLNCGSSIEMQW